MLPWHAISFLKALGMLTPIHQKMGDPSYGGHAIGKIILNLSFNGSEGALKGE